MIEVKNLKKVYGDRAVISGVSVSFEKGKVVALIGPSGGGKSTLLRCINGLEDFQGGEIHVGGEVLHPGGNAKNKRALLALRQRVGMVFQTWNLFAHRTATGNIVSAS